MKIEEKKNKIIGCHNIWSEKIEINEYYEWWSWDKIKVDCMCREKKLNIE